MSETVGERITARLKEIKMTQKELAEKAGLTQVSVSRYVNDTRSPKVATAKKIAKVLGCSANYLVGLEEEKKEPEPAVKKSEDHEQDFYKALRLTSRSADKWTNKQKAELINALMGVNE